MIIIFVIVFIIAPNIPDTSILSLTFVKLLSSYLFICIGTSIRVLHFDAKSKELFLKYLFNINKRFSTANLMMMILRKSNPRWRDNIG